MSRGGWGDAVRIAPGLALLCFAFAAASARAADTTVYRCLDAHLNVVYTDVPCKEGAPLEIRAGDADPAAVARLERVRDALDQAAMQRLSDERRLAAQRVVPVPVAPEAVQPEETYGYGPYYTYPVDGFFPHRFHRDRDHERLQRRFASRGSAPPPPYIVPRSFR